MDASSDDSTILQEKLLTEDVRSTCRRLKAGKAPGVDGLQGEHLKYGGPLFMDLVTQLYNAIVSKEWRPPSMKQGLIVPIPKGTKDHTIPDNNRGITLMPVLSKVLDTILLNKAENWIDSKLDELQGANRRGVSSIETSATLQEAIASNVKQGHTVYVALLDVKKAFDTVWHDGMFVKLYDMGMDPKLWRILRNSYSGFKCAVRVGGRPSSWFTPRARRPSGGRLLYALALPIYQRPPCGSANSVQRRPHL